MKNILNTAAAESYKFYHVRAVQYNSEDELQISPNGGATVASEYDPETKTLYAAIAFCHPNDNFNKYLGRVKSAARLFQLRGNQNLRDGVRYHITEGVEEKDVSKAMDLLLDELVLESSAGIAY